MLLYPLYLYDLIRVPGQPEINTETSYQSIKTKQRSLNKVCGCPVCFLRLVWVVLLFRSYVMSLWACCCWAFCMCPVCTFPVLCRSAVVLPLCRGFTCCSVSLLLGARMCSRPSSLWCCREYLWYLMLQIRFPVMALWSLEGERTTYLWVSRWYHKFPDLQQPLMMS